MQTANFMPPQKNRKKGWQKILQLGTIGLGLLVLAGFFLHFILATHTKVSVHIHNTNTAGAVAGDASSEIFVRTTMAAYKARIAKNQQTAKQAHHLITAYQEKKEKIVKDHYERLNQDANTALGVGDKTTLTAKEDLIALMQAPVEFQGESHGAQNVENDTGIKRVFAHILAHPKWTLFAGTVIPVEVSSAVSSQLPGLVIGKVLHNVYSGTNATNRHLLIPAGSAIFGEGQGVHSATQDRLNIIWNSLRLRLGDKMVRMSLSGAAMGGDLGKTGVAADSVNTHFALRFGEAALYSVISAGAATVGSGETGYSPANVYQTGLSQSFADAAQNSLQRHQNIPPTLSLYQSRTGTIIVRNDLDFYGAYH